MAARVEQTTELNVKQRLAIFHNTSVTAEQALVLKAEDITLDFLVQSGVKAVNLVVAGLRPMNLKRFGVTDAPQLRRLGFTALHLIDPSFCHEANSAYGADAVTEAFVNEPGAAVVVAGTEAATILDISTKKLLEVCAGAPTEALSVLGHHNGDAKCLQDVPAVTLLDAGIRAQQLKQLGFNFAQVMQCTSANKDQMLKLGFKL